MSDPTPGRLYWRKSSRSTEHGTNCVEVAAPVMSKRILTRDSKDPSGPALGFTRAEWSAFMGEAKRGAFDLA
ncbi:DUF397 domain-containing protein [Actinomadura darangshiensis]|uniref:DUF397 domain-containing protein n=1 Tax=Actinomadura darangshiensis TaxID=705336 RepID=A0A4R4ZV74_9ACTN|nr:DUF397 domain-containing protein [Actinomadura darangshiensis]TDD62785.1 DUF397 domain-containing protein [Actinomadura darangshiensis]